MAANQFPALPQLDISGTFANRPVAGTPGRRYRATDTENLYYDTGTTWLQIPTSGGGGSFDAGKTITLKDTAGDMQMKTHGGANRQEVILQDASGRNYIWVVGSLSTAVTAERIVFAAGNAGQMSIDVNGVHSTTLRSVFDRIYVQSNTGVSGAQTLDFTAASTIYIFLNGSTTFTTTWPSMSTPSNPGYSNASFTVRLLMYFASVPTITWPSDVYWPDSTAPTFTASKINEVILHRWHNSGGWRTHATHVAARD